MKDDYYKKWDILQGKISKMLIKKFVVTKDVAQDIEFEILNLLKKQKKI